MKKILLGVGIEIAALAIMLLSELWKLPLTFTLLAHLTAVFFFTKGFDPRLAAIHLRRELCFFFSLIFPLAGMAGIVFFIFVLKRLEPRLKLSESPVPVQPPAAEHLESVFLEDDHFPALYTAFVRKMALPLTDGHDARQEAEIGQTVGCREEEYWRRERELSARIAAEETAARSAPGTEAKRRLADSLLEYAALFPTDISLREHFLRRFFMLYQDADAPPDKSVLEKHAEAAFHNGRYRECVGYCERLRQIEFYNITALARKAECHFRLKEFKKLGLLAREIASSSAVPAGLREIGRMWCQYG